MPTGFDLDPSLPAQLFRSPSLFVHPWVDDVIDALGHDPRSWYVEKFWLGILGPSTTWLLRRTATSFEEHPDGFELPLSETAREIGLGDKGGRHSPFVRALVRCCQFDMARPDDDGLAVRRRLPPLNRRQICRLPDHLRAEHDRWQETQLGRPRQPTAADIRRRAEELAASLVQAGDDADAVERQLLRWRFHPTLAHEAAVWAAGEGVAARTPPGAA